MCSFPFKIWSFFFPKASLSTFPCFNSIFNTKMWEFGLLIMSQWSQILWTKLLITFSVLLLQCSHSSALSPSPDILLLPVLVFGADCIWFIEVYIPSVSIGFLSEFHPHLFSISYPYLKFTSFISSCLAPL